MSTRYIRNRIYVTQEEQKMIKDFPVLLAGSGIGSVIAECALRLGFENITIIDGDQVEESNLNRQNYVNSDVSLNKVDVIKNRLLSIHPEANITVHNCYLTSNNIDLFLEGKKAAINALDFSSDTPLIFDKLCQQNYIPVLHPYNLGWGGLLAVISSKSPSLESIAKPNEDFTEVNVVEYASSYLKFWGNPHDWINEVLTRYKEEEEIISPPQLSVASYLVASMCTHILFNIATGKEIKEFPEFYMTTLMNQ